MWYVKLLKVVNLSVKSFFDKNIQTLASSLTYTTLLAVIPILSLLLAIARGFGMRDVLIQSLYKGLPSQRAMLENSLDFVDRFLATLSKGVFVGIGVGIIVRQGSSSGGDDALALVIHQLTGWKLARSYLFTDLVVLGASLSYIPARRIAFSLVTVTVSSLLIDWVKEYTPKNGKTNV